MDHERFAVDEDLTRYAFWRSGSGLGRVGSLREDPGAVPVDFVENEVLVDPADTEVIDDLVTQYGAQVHEEPPIPNPPREVGEGQMHVLNDAPPLPLRLTFSDDLLERPGADELADALDEVNPDLAASSPLAAAVAGVIARYAEREQGPFLNMIGDSTTALPLEAPSDINTRAGEPMQRCRILDAWQLLDSVRTFRSIKPVVWVAVIDSGFAIDPVTGVPDSPDLAGSFGFNLHTKRGDPWGQRGTGKTPEGPVPWHGHGAASAAVAVVNNSGVAGSGGTVAHAAMMHLRTINADDALYGVKCCYAWGLDVVNFSISWRYWGLKGPPSGWGKQFDFADRNRVVIVAAAGNYKERLPEDARRYPQTRTPGVITVGALASKKDERAHYSNYGSSVSVWAPGDVIIPPDPDSETGALTVYSGTSAAAPVVAGVAAMMKAVDPSLTSSQVRHIFRHEAGDDSMPWPARPALDAFAALWTALGRAMPPDFPDGNKTAGSATRLTTLASGELGPPKAGLASISAGSRDWWRFEVTGYTDVRIELRWYRRLAQLHPTITGDGSAAARAAERLELTRVGESTVLTGFLPPGVYRIGVGSDGPTVYRLLVTPTPSRLPRDVFEDNNTLERAARMLLEPPDLLSRLSGRHWGPGTYDATLHRVGTRMDVDYYRFTTGEAQFYEPSATVSHPDFQVTVELLAKDGRKIGRPVKVAAGDSHRVRLPGGTTCFLRITGQQETRYELTTGLGWREGIPRYWEKHDLIPQWWLDLAGHRIQDELSWVVDTRNFEKDRIISFVSEPGVEVVAQTPAGHELTFVPDQTGHIDIDVTALGHHALLLTARTVDGISSATIAQVPPIRMR
jgi:hypothetical protein